MLPIPPPPAGDSAPSGDTTPRPLTRGRLFRKWAIALSILLLLANSEQRDLKGEWAGFPLVFWSRFAGPASFDIGALAVDVGVWMAVMWLAWLYAWFRFRSPPK